MSCGATTRRRSKCLPASACCDRRSTSATATSSPTIQTSTTPAAVTWPYWERPASPYRIALSTSCAVPRTLDTWERYRSAGVNLALGTDTYPRDMIMNMRTASYLGKITSRNLQAAPAGQVFEAATLGRQPRTGSQRYRQTGTRRARGHHHGRYRPPRCVAVHANLRPDQDAHRVWHRRRCQHGHRRRRGANARGR